MKNETVVSDVTVIGGGLAGVCAAVAAARQGRSVALVQNRPVLGGNSSSEVRVWVCGATAHGTQRYARETGIMGEMFVENQYQNPDGNPYFWDLVVLETVRAEPNIRLFLNTDVHEVEADGPEEERTIRSVTGWMMGSERRIRFESAMFLDCTGDGLVGFLAGAKYRIGREARHEYGEEWAPEAADDITLGSTILFYTKDAGHPVRFVKPSFAKDITQTSIPMRRVIKSGHSGCHYWWIEWGGEFDTVHDNERIRDELWSAIYGIWDYIKNSGSFPDAENMTLEWVGAVPGKREYRRFVGDYVLNQNDILAQEPFEDRIAFGGWSIDLHPPQGMYAQESGSKHMYSDGVYHIPFRSLYSVNVQNLMFAGRNISASHVAFGTTRVMATCAVIGEAAGTGAALGVKLGVSPRELYRSHLGLLQQTMLKADASIIGLASTDALDLARQAAVTASSVCRRLAVETPAERVPLTQAAGLLLPAYGALDGIELLIDAGSDTVLEAALHDTGRPENYVPAGERARVRVALRAGERQWVRLPLAWTPETPQNAFLTIEANSDVSLYTSAEPMTGVLAFGNNAKPEEEHKLEAKSISQPVVQWSMRRFVRKPFCFRLIGETAAYEAANVIDGFNRPYGGPHMWVSEPMALGREEYVELRWRQPIGINEVHVTWNDDVNEDLINLHHHFTPFEIIPELAKDYRLEAFADGEWKAVAEVKSNRKRKRVHNLDRTVTAERLRVVVESTNGCPRAEMVEIRVYGNE
ncbi:FAD-dependent oxidoreductase [Paenibacillus hamazuiensis]|uniref:FAD-dependent oxidoreductase n=1 Tax=Paenibacillus hamazuiensis TaxID=2936508 RepID=UPI00200F8FB5|nr:FAD-dependent oxidoreductase [Paenibacillus hamazuiensis]